MQVGDAPAGVDHGQRRPAGQGGFDLSANGGTVAELLQAGEDRGQAVVGGEPCRGQDAAMAFEDGRDEGLDDMPEDDRVRDLHHRRL